MKRYFIRFIDSIRNLFRKKTERVVVHHAAEKEYEYNARRAKNRAEVDRLLDKINRFGKESLTKTECEFLKHTHEL